MRFIIAIMIIISLTNAFQIKPINNKKFPKVSYTKIHDISYRSPIRIRRMEPFAFTLVKQIGDFITNYINESYAMASFPLSYNFANRLNETKLNQKY